MENSIIFSRFKDELEFSDIFKKYYSSLCIFAERIVGVEDARDVIEELFIGLWEKDKELQNEEHLRAFLYHSAKNACLNFLKSDLRAKELNTVYVKEFSDNEDLYLAEITRSELLRKLHIAIDELPQQCGNIIKLGYIDGLKNSQIADQLGLSVQTVKNQKLRGIALLKKKFPYGQFILLLLLLEQHR